MKGLVLVLMQRFTTVRRTKRRVNIKQNSLNNSIEEVECRVCSSLRVRLRMRVVSVLVVALAELKRWKYF